jgi:phospholipid/cholesterol/gamma-HCH transport system substrate-binding protein
MPRRSGSAVRVGALVLVSLALLATITFLIGRENNLFTRKDDYYVDFSTVSGIKPGNPVEIDGVSVGSIERVVLPRDPTKKYIRVRLSVDRRYSERVRRDSRAHIRTLGLLGDKYVELNSGTPAYPVIPPGGRILAAPATNVDALISSGTDVMDNVSTISFQLKDILGRIDKGQGLIGELTSDSASGRQMKASIFETLDNVNRVAAEVEHGDGPLPRLLNDRQLADRLASSIAGLDGIVASVKGGQGLLPGLLNDPATRRSYDETVGSLQKVAADLQKLTGDLEHGDGLVPKLLHDEAYAREVSGKVRAIVDHLDSVATKLDRGKGTAAELINDPKVYDAVNDILVGVNDSRLLRWLIRNRQSAGIKRRYDEAGGSKGAGAKDDGATAPPLAGPGDADAGATATPSTAPADPAAGRPIPPPRR